MKQNEIKWIMYIYSIFVGINTQIRNYHDRTGTVPMWFGCLHRAGCGTPIWICPITFFLNTKTCLRKSLCWRSYQNSLVSDVMVNLVSLWKYLLFNLHPSALRILCSSTSLAFSQLFLVPCAAPDPTSHRLFQQRVGALGGCQPAHIHTTVLQPLCHLQISLARHMHGTKMSWHRWKAVSITGKCLPVGKPDNQTDLGRHARNFLMLPPLHDPMQQTGCGIKTKRATTVLKNLYKSLAQ